MVAHHVYKYTCACLFAVNMEQSSVIVFEEKKLKATKRNKPNKTHNPHIIIGTWYDNSSQDYTFTIQPKLLLFSGNYSTINGVWVCIVIVYTLHQLVWWNATSAIRLLHSRLWCLVVICFSLRMFAFWWTNIFCANSQCLITWLVHCFSSGFIIFGISIFSLSLPLSDFGYMRKTLKNTYTNYYGNFPGDHIEWMMFWMPWHFY